GTELNAAGSLPASCSSSQPPTAASPDRHPPAGELRKPRRPRPRRPPPGQLLTLPPTVSEGADSLVVFCRHCPSFPPLWPTPLIPWCYTWPPVRRCCGNPLPQRSLSPVSSGFATTRYRGVQL